jgi:NAD(P)-dependent dehydrogenase (short-subunit alcohol dehydrogenase family)
MNRKLENKVAVITGGSAGIGLGAAKRFVAEGARVFITGRRQSDLDKAVAAIEGNVTAIQGEASKITDIDHIYQTVKRKAGRIDVLLVNAGFYEFGKLGGITEEHFDKTFNTNVRGLLFAVQKAMPLLSKGSSAYPQWLSRIDQRIRSVLCLQCCPQLDQRSQGSQYPGERPESRPHRNSRTFGPDE